jgi:hypothetical protein
MDISLFRVGANVPIAAIGYFGDADLLFPSNGITLRTGFVGAKGPYRSPMVFRHPLSVLSRGALVLLH